jgi:hypothetical protein
MIAPSVLVAAPDERTVLAYVIASPPGKRYVIYNPAVLGNPSDHSRDKWYFAPYPVSPGIVAGEAFDTAADAGQAALLADALGDGARSG